MKRQRLRHVGNLDEGDIAKSAWLVCETCGVEYHTFRIAVRAEKSPVYERWFACDRCGNLRQWGLVNTTRCKAAMA